MARGDTKLVELLKTIPLFATWSKRELQRLAPIVKDVHFDQGAMICREGETGVGLHLIVEGETKVVVGGKTRRRLGPGAFFGEIALLDGGPRTATVLAETPVRTLAIASWSFKNILKNHPELAIRMLEEICRRIRTIDSSLAN